MKSIFKLSAFVLLISVFIYESGFLYIDNLYFHISCLAVMLLACLVRFGIKKLTLEIKLFLPFIVTMLAIYMLMGILGIKFTDNRFKTDIVFLYWLHYGISRSVLFINTLFVLQLLLSYISMNDIITLPMKISGKRYLILGRALFIHSVKYVEELEFHLRLLPEYQKKRLSFVQWFRFKLQLSLAIIVMLLRESKLKGELIDNRIMHCFSASERSIT